MTGRGKARGQQKKARCQQRRNRSEKKSPASAGSGSASAATHRRTIIALLCLVLLGSAVYLNSLHNQFVFDDIPLIRDNPSIRDLSRVPSYLLSGINKAPYRPLRWVSYAIDYRFSGLNPVAYHVSNIILHCVTAIILYLTIAALTGSGRAAFFAACLFAVHPVHTDSVTYISGRRDILSTLFYLIGFFIFLRSRQKNRHGLLVLSLASYLLAIASKEMAVTLPAVFFIYDFINNLSSDGPLFRRCAASLKKIVSRHKLFYLCFLTPAVLFTGYKVLIKYPSTMIGFYGGKLYIQLLTLAKILLYYIKLLLFPVTLIADYSFNSFPLVTSILEPAAFLSIIALCLIAFVTVKLLLSDAIMAFAIIWFFITLLPVCHIFPHHELLAEHYLYLPSFGFVLLASLLFNRAAATARWKWPTYALFTVIIALLSVRTFHRNYDWKDSFTIWSKTVETVPSCVRAINNLGVEYYNRKDYETAKSLYRRAITIQPSYVRSYYNFGNVYSVEKDYARALPMYQKAAQLDPKNLMYLNNLGNAYAMQENFPDAIKSYQRALEQNPRYAEAYNNLGNVYRSLRDADLAIAHYQKAITVNPYYMDAYYNLSGTYSYLKRYEQSIQVLLQAIQKNRFQPATYSKLGAVYEKTAQYDNAVEAYKQAITFNPGFSEAHFDLGRVYTLTNRYQQAVEQYQKAIEMQPASPDAHFNLAHIYLEKVMDKKKALYHLRMVLEKAPRHPQAERIKEVIRTLEMEKAG